MLEESEEVLPQSVEVSDVPDVDELVEEVPVDVDDELAPEEELLLVDDDVSVVVVVVVSLGQSELS